MKNIVKIISALATIAGAVYLIATYGDQIVAWAKKVMESLPCCKSEETCEEPVEEVTPVEAAVEEVTEAVEEAVEEVAEAAEEVAEEVAEAVEEAVDEAAVVAEEADFEQ